VAAGAAAALQLRALVTRARAHARGPPYPASRDIRGGGLSGVTLSSINRTPLRFLGLLFWPLGGCALISIPPKAIIVCFLSKMPWSVCSRVREFQGRSFAESQG